MDKFTIIVKSNDINHKKKDGDHWSRVFLFQKELNSYRWISGKYSNDVISFVYTLEAGLYYLILMPDWSKEAHLNCNITSYG
jgi:hypothetical protein